jgi:type I restriction enzyme R subunit
VNVSHEIFRIKTERGEHDGKVDAGDTVPLRDRKTRCWRN